MNVPVNDPFDTTTSTEPPAASRRFQWRTVILAGILAACLGFIALIAGTIYNDTKNADPYHLWPATGTQVFAGEAPLYANAMVAVTCRDGKTHVDEMMLVKPTREGTLPSWYMQFYVSYDQSRSDFCSLSWKAYNPTTKVVTLELMHEAPEWALIGPGISFDGLNSVSIEKKHAGGIAVLLISLADQPQGPEIKNGPNGIPAPGRELLEGATD